MISQFINDFKKTSYYLKLIADKNIVCMYISGSYCLGLDDEESDYDLVILTMDGESIDSSKELFLKYKGKKVHWYYVPIRDLFELSYDGLSLLCPIQLKQFSEDLTIYKNEKYTWVLETILSHKDIISKAAIYRLFDVYNAKILKILEQKDIFMSDFSKIIYHLCFATYWLLEEEFDKEFLIDLKKILRRPIKTETKIKAIKYLNFGYDYINKFKINYNNKLSTALNELLKIINT